MSVIARTLGVSRSNLIERSSKPSKPRGPYRKVDDVALLAELRPIIDQRPTYGDRRVTALLNRQRRKERKPTSGRGAGHRPALHPGSKPSEQRHVRGLRQNPEKGLRLNRHPP